jgi:predicted O-methyltransferase YrrM
MEPKELHLIDLFEGIVPSGDKDGENMIHCNLNEEYQILSEKYFKSNVVKLHKGSSNDILKKFPNDYFDMVYIDADHSYDGVKSDLEICYNKVKNGGYICGHDYTTHRFPGVVQAVDEFNEKNNYSIEIITSDGCPSYCMINKKK